MKTAPLRWLKSTPTHPGGLQMTALHPMISCGKNQAFPLAGTLHQIVSLKLAAALLRYVEPRNLGQIIQAPFQVVLSRETIIQPDILFIRKGRVALIGDHSLHGTPDLIIEVISPETRRYDRLIKRKIYSLFEVAEYWIVDPYHQTIEVLIWSEWGYAEGGVYFKSDYLASFTLPGFRLPANKIFPPDRHGTTAPHRRR